MAPKKAALLSTPPEVDQLLNPEETADRLRTTPGTLAVWRSTKRYGLKFVRVGARVFYRASAIQRFIEQRETLETAHPNQSYRKSKKAVRP